mgnify:CR=1 FL=1
MPLPRSAAVISDWLCRCLTVKISMSGWLSTVSTNVHVRISGVLLAQVITVVNMIGVITVLSIYRSATPGLLGQNLGVPSQ